jgi:putative membrane protein
MKLKFLSRFALIVFSSLFALSAKAYTDASIAEIVETANNAEIDAAQLAKKNASNDQVKQFAAEMIKDHKENNKDKKAVLKKNKLSEEKSDESKELKKMAGDKKSELKKLKGAEFDKAYIDEQVAMHKDLLQKLESEYIPKADNAELKAYLEKTKADVQGHLAKAEEIQKSLSK